MKFNIGDKVKYDGGEWLFYGRVNAIFEHSINPCYRINVDKIIKKSCKLSITQFEFELEVDDETAEITENEILTEKINAKLEEIENATTIFKHEIEESKRLNLLMDSVIEKQKVAEVRPKKVQTTLKPIKKKATWHENFEKYKNGDRSSTIKAWAAQNRKEYKTGKMNEEKKDMLIKIRFPLMIVKRKKR